jgi:Transposase IS4
LNDINGAFPHREWGVKTPIGDVLRSGCNIDNRFSRLDIFFFMFPPTQLDIMTRCTNTILEEKNKRRTTVGELVQFLGIVILTTRFEFKSRASLWSTTSPSKYEIPPSFGRTGMKRQRFDELWQCIRWSFQPKERPEGMSSEKFRWKLVDGFVEQFNDHRVRMFIPSEYICVDESISRWYGQGGEWINHGLPMYIAIDRKPENGCEIQNAACAKSGVMIRLKLVKTAEEERTHTQEGNDGLLHGTIILKFLISPWTFSHRMICADSYFASVGAAKELLRCGLRFIGVVKTATKQYPMNYLSTLELQERGDRQGLIMKGDNENPILLAFVWMDRDRRYFVASGSSLNEGSPYFRERWRQIGLENASPTKIKLTIPQPKAAETYYSVCSAIDKHNRDRQDTLMIERKLKTHDWSTRVNLSIFAVIIVDCWKVYNKLTFTSENNSGEVQKEFYAHLAAEMIDNNYDSVTTSERRNVASANDVESPVFCRRTGAPRCGLSAHLTPTKRKKHLRDGTETSYSLQGRCRVCAAKTIFQCSLCKDDPDIDDEGWLCTTKKGKACFPSHIGMEHSNI